MIEVEKNLFLK